MLEARRRAGDVLRAGPLGDRLSRPARGGSPPPATWSATTRTTTRRWTRSPTPASRATCARPRTPSASSPASIRGRGFAARSATATTIRACSRRSTGPVIATTTGTSSPTTGGPSARRPTSRGWSIDGALAPRRRRGGAAAQLAAGHDRRAARDPDRPARGRRARWCGSTRWPHEPAHRDRRRRRQLEDRRRHPRRDRPGARHVARAGGVVLARRPRPLDRRPRPVGARGRAGGRDRRPAPSPTSASSAWRAPTCRPTTAASCGRCAASASCPSRCCATTPSR